MNKNLRDALDDAYNEEHTLDAHADTLDALHKAMRDKHERRSPILIRMLRYHMPAYQTLALAGVLVSVIAWMYFTRTDGAAPQNVVLDNGTASQTVSQMPPHTTSQTLLRGSVDTDAIVRRVVDSLRGEMQRESEKTRRSLEGVTRKSIERVAKNIYGGNARPLESPLQNDGAVGLENLTQLQYQQRGKSLADDGMSTRFGDTATSEMLR